MTGSISVVAFSFIVQEPSGIMPAVQRVVGVREPGDVAQHRRLRAVLGEDRVGEVAALAGEAGRQGVGRLPDALGERVVVDAEGGPDAAAGGWRRSARRS